MSFIGQLRANTAVDVLIGPFIDDQDGISEELGLTISQADVLLSKNGQSLTQKTDVTAASHDAKGYYNCELDATDTDTEGALTLIVHEPGALSIRHDFMVLSEAAYDSLYGAKDSGFMDVNVKAVSEDETAADSLESACDNYSATRGLSGTALPDAAAGAGGGLPVSDAGGLDLDTKLANAHEVTAARMGALTDWIDGGRLDILIDAIKAKTDNLPSGVPKNVALSNFEFLMVDSADHVSAKTGLTVAAQISQDGGAFANCSNAASEISSGVYVVDLTQAEMNADIITLKFTGTGADQRTVTMKTSA